MTVTREQAIEIARTDRNGIPDGKVEEARLEGDPPVWIVTGLADRASEAPQLANIIIRVRLRLTIDSTTGRVVARSVVGDPKYIPDPSHPSRSGEYHRVWHRQMTHAGTTHDVLIYSLPMTPGHARRGLYRGVQIGYEALIDGEWAAPEGYMIYLSFEDALEAVREAIGMSERTT